VVTVYFQASVSAQRNAYASGVLVLMSSAAVVTVLDLRKKRHGDRETRRQGEKSPVSLSPGFLVSVSTWLGVVYFTLVAAIFVLITVAVAVHSASGLVISGCFILALLGTSVVSRALRAGEKRTIGFEFVDDQSKFLWDSLRLADFPVLVPHRPGRSERDAKETHIREVHQLDPDAEIVFLEVEVDDPSNFFQRLLIEVIQEDRRFIIKTTRCVSVAHAIASVALEMSSESKPPGLHFGWPELGVLAASWSYLAFGEGNIPWKVRDLIQMTEPNPERRPRVIVG